MILKLICLYILHGDNTGISQERKCVQIIAITKRPYIAKSLD